MVYPKKRRETGIRVIIHMSVRGHYQAADHCHHWYLTFDDNKCTNPANIEQLDYSATTGDRHHPMDSQYLYRYVHTLVKMLLYDLLLMLVYFCFLSTQLII